MFLWGAATSGHQVDGGNIHSDWWAWEAQGGCEGGARSGAACDHWSLFREDLKLAADLGLNSYRFSVEWARLEPEEGRWDMAAFDWYRTLIAECEHLGLVPMLTLHHFTSPRWLAEKGGFTWDGVVERFALFTEKVAKEIGPRVPLWCTLNEPMVLVAGTYLGTFMPPAQHDPKAAAMACRNLLACHVRAYEILHRQLGRGGAERLGTWRDRPLEVGLAHNMLDFMPDRPWHPLENILSRAFWGFYNRAWLDAITGRKQRFGVPGLMPFAPQLPEARDRVTADFIGVNYYTKAYVQWRPRAKAHERPSNLPIGLEFARRKEAASDVEWAVHPKGLGKMLRYAASYGLPIHITENGIADSRDHLRPGYLVSHLGEVARALQAGIDVRGYYHWSLLDNFEWIKGFGPRFGLYRLNFDTFERTATGSALLFKKLIDAHGGAPPGLEVLAEPAFSAWIKQQNA